jgi:natural product biosynthesis luciferase-like monooxygenase protein
MNNPNQGSLPRVAIIGMAGRFPGARNIDEFWSNLRDGVESISTFSPEELEFAAGDADLVRHPRYVRRKAIVTDVELFDFAFFDFTRREAELADPQQRLFLQCAWEALENAGYDPARCGKTTGIFGGVGFNHYLLVNLLSNRRVIESSGFLQTSIRNRTDHLATSVAYKLNLQGPAVTVQTACSTSLVAVHLACQSLLHYESEMVLAGGSSISLPQKSGYLFQEGGILSPDGLCRAFDSRAAGTVTGNGAAVVVLKRLADALADRDHIHAVILGSAIANDGSGKVGYTAPSIEGQSRVIAEALSVAQVDPDSIGYVEAHGTGTKMGDPIEIAALNEAFKPRSSRRSFCALGSVKTNIGHLDAAAGVAGLIKTVLTIERRQVPPSLHFEEPNPEISFHDSPFFVNAALRGWNSEGPRRAGVSSFGIGGTNAHVVLEESPSVSSGETTRPYQLLLLSAKTSTALEAATARLGDVLQADAPLKLADVAYTLQVGRGEFSHRRAIVAGNREETIKALSSLDPHLVKTGFYEPKSRPVVFMFPGQGAQYVNMGRGLYDHEPTFRKHVDACSRWLEPLLGFWLPNVLFPPAGEEADAMERLKQTHITQPALFVIEYAMAMLWMEWGLQPRAMIGHSIGEYVAACLSGVLSVEDALALVEARGRLMQSVAGGAMLAVPLPADECSAYAAEFSLSLAAVNGPESCVISGPHDSIDRLEEALTARNLACRRLVTSHAFHSSMMESILSEFAGICRGIRFGRPDVPYISNLTGTWVTESDLISSDYWVRHLRQTVRFSEGVRELIKDPDWILLEVGPGRTLSTFARWNPYRATGQVVLNSMRHPSDPGSDEAFLLMTVGKLWMAGVGFYWPGFYRHEQRKRVPLPTYPFEGQRCWVDAQPQTEKPTETRKLAKRASIDEWFYAPSWKRSVRELQSDPKQSGGPWLIFSDGCGLAQELATALSRRGVEVLIASDGDSFMANGRSFTLGFTTADQYNDLFQQLNDSGQWPSRIIHLSNVVDPNGPRARFEASFFGPIYLAQAMGRTGKPRPVEILFVSNYMYDVTGDRVIGPERATMLGPCRVIPQEYASISCRQVDIDFTPGQPLQEAFLSQMIMEFASTSPDSIVAYRTGHRWVQSFESLPAWSLDRTRLRHGGVYLITGGLGGIGLVIAEYLAREWQAKLILTGRSEFPHREQWVHWLDTHLGQPDAVSRKIRKVQEIEALEAQVLVLTADVSDRTAMRNAIGEARGRFGCIHGVIHAAGVPGDGVIQLKTDEAANSVLAPKVKGALVLSEAFADTQLDFFLACSSRSSMLGGFGQVDYCAANAFLDVFAAHSHIAEGNRMVAVNWDAWQHVGMLVAKAAEFDARPKPEPSRRVDHPLFDQRHTESPDTEVYTTIFSPLTHWVLDEHRIVGNAVIPGTAYLEMARAATEKYAGDSVVEIRDAFFLAPLGLRDDESREVKMIVRKDGPGFELRVISRPADDSEWREYSTGRVGFVPRGPAKRHNIESILERCNSRHVAVTDDTKRDEDLGPRWQALKHAYVGQDEHLAILELPEQFADELDVLKLHPSLLDRATGTGKEFLIREGVYLPMGYRRLRIYGPLERKIYVHVRFRPQEDVTGQTITFDALFMNEQGDVLVEIEAFAQKRVIDITGQIKVFANRQYGRRDAGEKVQRPTNHDHLMDGIYQQQLEQGITPAEGVEAFRRILALKGLPQVVVSARDLHASISESLHRQALNIFGQATAQPGAAETSQPQAVASFGAQRSVGDAEQQIADVWRRVLGIDEVGVHDNFFEIGGDSVQAIQIIAQVNQLGYQLTPQQLFQHQTIAELATIAAASQPPPPVASESAEILGLSLSPLSPPAIQHEPAVIVADAIPVEAPAVVRNRAGEICDSARDVKRSMDFSLFYFADSNSGMSGDKYRLYLEGAKFADGHEFHGIWTPERHFHQKGGLYPNPSVLSAAVAAITKKLQIRAGSVVMPLHNPLRVAEEWSVVDNLSGGRVGISVVSGWVPNDFAFFPERYANKRAEMFRGIEQVQKLWRGEKIGAMDGAGKNTEIGIFPRPVQSELPVWLTCSGSPEMFVKAGEAGFHVLTSLQQQTIDEVAANLQKYREALAGGGFDPHSRKIAMMMHTFVGPDKERVLATVRGPLSNFLRSHLDLIKTYTDSLDIQAGLEKPELIESILAFAFERYYRTASLIGTPSSCLPMINRLRAIGVTEVACLIDFGVDVDETLRSLTYLDELRMLDQLEAAGAREIALTA